MKLLAVQVACHRAGLFTDREFLKAGAARSPTTNCKT